LLSGDWTCVTYLSWAELNGDTVLVAHCFLVCISNYCFTYATFVLLELVPLQMFTSGMSQVHAFKMYSKLKAYGGRLIREFRPESSGQQMADRYGTYIVQKPHAQKLKICAIIL
jgi:hypothetical protein